MASSKYIEFEELVENAATDALNCSEKLQSAARTLSKMGERPITIKKFEKLRQLADQLSEDLTILAEEVTEKRHAADDAEMEEEDAEV